MTLLATLRLTDPGISDDRRAVGTRDPCDLNNDRAGIADRPTAIGNNTGRLLARNRARSGIDEGRGSADGDTEPARTGGRNGPGISARPGQILDYGSAALSTSRSIEYCRQ